MLRFTESLKPPGKKFSNEHIDTRGLYDPLIAGALCLWTPRGRSRLNSEAGRTEGLCLPTDVRRLLDNSERSWSTIQEIIPRSKVARTCRPRSRAPPRLLAPSRFSPTTRDISACVDSNQTERIWKVLSEAPAAFGPRRGLIPKRPAQLYTNVLPYLLNCEWAWRLCGGYQSR
ncbi:hypothetical protein EVAR_17384_1 [Eumeta japonica]|uniref:Uncharacterized protein n=1 Tax=Eumeta variegata TaxID=151549 RepID=A0A4C1V9V2_EUMVA|nr:hypothetical protein EVAR_17384_1 [Eumeta japonica]